MDSFTPKEARMVLYGSLSAVILTIIIYLLVCVL